MVSSGFRLDGLAFMVFASNFTYAWVKTFSRTARGRPRTDFRTFRVILFFSWSAKKTPSLFLIDARLIEIE